jgi:hypothetical protein
MARWNTLQSFTGEDNYLGSVEESNSTVLVMWLRFGSELEVGLESELELGLN